MDCNCNCIDVQGVLPSIWIPVSLAFLSTQVLQFQWVLLNSFKFRGQKVIKLHEYIST